ncbi:MAG TPA: non-heme iron oxygenase ferredoxin subunit [Ramlibacter sp.]|uniref:Rieske (2Fe-2S) protein n=1 Tax=Ramlibacter sp. TaxID=1917967 RepID=UPI002B7CCF65|nr:non-heme iron oxygenase ferredoxin subunit [Ramlibacter sp.]HVZ45425.1 non-heme iron oxygenase ferredoxin subunit [Ramlibacter sp.]
MSEWHKACASDDVSEGGPFGCVLAGVEIAIFRIGERCFATSNVCTHEVAMLSEGWQEGDEIECPVHQARFRITDGKCTAGPAKDDLRCFQVDEKDGAVYVAVDPE